MSKGSEAAYAAAIGGHVAVAGVGTTDFAADWRRVRSEGAWSDAYGFALRALKAALADAGLKKTDIDGIVVGKLDYLRMAETAGVDVRHAAQAETDQAVIQASMAIVSGMAECVAVIYGTDQRSAKAAYGGPGVGEESPLSYRYYAPWGLTSQGGLYALMTRRYMEMTGLGEADLGAVAVAERAWASMNPKAIMKSRLTIEDYLASRYIAEPLRLLDYAMVNDGGVAMIITSTERARQLVGNRAVVVRAVARADLTIDTTSLRPRLMDFYHTGHRAAASRVYERASCGPQDMDALEIYDGFSCRVPFALAGFGFATDETVGPMLRRGETGPGGRLPVNTAGGHLSESYMHGWGHQVEAVRQLRHECGDRQIEGARLIQYISDVGGKVTTTIYGNDKGGAA